MMVVELKFVKVFPLQGRDLVNLAVLFTNIISYFYSQSIIGTDKYKNIYVDQKMLKGLAIWLMIRPWVPWRASMQIRRVPWYMGRG